MSSLKDYARLPFLFLLLFPSAGVAEQISTSTAVRNNIAILSESKSCQGCDFIGAVLNRLDLSGANLEGANLSRAKMSLTNLAGANLRNADLREVIFSGADLADADLRGANLTGASLVGAYLSGALMDGEMVTSNPYDQEGINNFSETVYVVDTVSSKVPTVSEEIVIENRRDFEETPPVIPVNTENSIDTESAQGEDSVEDVSVGYDDSALPKQSAAAPEVKKNPEIQNVMVAEDGTDQNIKPTGERTGSEEVIVTESGVQVTVSPEENSTDKEATGVLIADSSLNTADPQGESSGKGNEQNTIAVLADASLDSVPEKINEEDIEEGNADTMAGLEGASMEEKDITGGDSAHTTDSVVDSIFNVFSSVGPTTIIDDNIAILLDTNKCYGCNLSGADLSGKDLEDADLESADLSWAKLSDADLQNANLKNANLTGADLTGADLSEADLYKATVEGMDLTGATLENTLLDDVDLSTVKGYKTQALILMQ